MEMPIIVDRGLENGVIGTAVSMVLLVGDIMFITRLLSMTRLEQIAHMALQNVMMDVTISCIPVLLVHLAQHN